MLRGTMAVVRNCSVAGLLATDQSLRFLRFLRSFGGGFAWLADAPSVADALIQPAAVVIRPRQTKQRIL
jgi:hypothetical protein